MRLGLATRAQCVEYLGSHFRVALGAADGASDWDVGQRLLRQYVFRHLERPADKMLLLLQMLHKLYALVRGLARPGGFSWGGRGCCCGWTAAWWRQLPCMHTCAAVWLALVPASLACKHTACCWSLLLQPSPPGVSKPHCPAMHRDAPHR